MPSSHLPRTPCDKFVYDFPCDFWGIVGGYGLRRMCSHCLRAFCDFFYGASGTETVRRLYGNLAMSVQLPCSLHSLRTEIVRNPCGDQPSHGVHAGIVQCHLRHVYGLRAYNFSLNQIVESAEPMNPYESLTAASCLRREASRRLHGKGDTGRIRAP